MVQFFIPHLQGDPAAVEAEWERYLRESCAPQDSRRVYSFTYVHEGDDKFELTVGEICKQCPLRGGPRGGRLKDAEHQGWGIRTGTMVLCIIEGGDRLYVWFQEPSSATWANPAWISRGEVTRIEYFDEDDARPEAGAR